MVGTVAVESGGERIGVPVVDVEPGVTQLAGKPPHSGDHQVEALAVEPLRGHLGRTLHHEDPGALR